MKLHISRESLFLIISNAVMIVLCVIATVWSGFSRVGQTELFLPENQMCLAYLPFLLASIALFFLWHYKVPFADFAFIIVETILFVLIFGMLNFYVLGSDWMFLKPNGNFYDNITYSVLSYVFIITYLASAAFEIAFSVKKHIARNKAIALAKNAAM